MQLFFFIFLSFFVPVLMAHSRAANFDPARRCVQRILKGTVYTQTLPSLFGSMGVFQRIGGSSSYQIALGGNGNVLIWDVRNERRIQRVRVHGQVLSIHPAGSGRSFGIVTSARRGYHIDPSRHELTRVDFPIGEMGMPAPVSSVDLDPAGPRILVSYATAPRVVGDFSVTDPLLRPLSVALPGDGVAMRAHVRYLSTVNAFSDIVLVSASMGGLASVQVVDAAGQSITLAGIRIPTGIDGHKNLEILASPHSPHFVISVRTGSREVWSTLFRWERFSRTEMNVQRMHTYISLAQASIPPMRFSRKGQWLIGTQTGDVHVYDLKIAGSDPSSPSVPVVFTGAHEGSEILSLDVSSDGQWFASGAENGSLALWSSTPERPSTVITDLETRVTGVSIVGRSESPHLIGSRERTGYRSLRTVFRVEGF